MLDIPVGCEISVRLLDETLHILSMAAMPSLSSICKEREGSCAVKFVCPTPLGSIHFPQDFNIDKPGSSLGA